MNAVRETLVERYAELAELPARLLRPAVTHIHGDLHARVETLVRIRRALLVNGALPARAELTWPDAPIRDIVLEQLEASRILAFCEGEPELVDRVLLFLLGEVDDATRLYERARRVERLRCRARPGGSGDRDNTSGVVPAGDPDDAVSESACDFVRMLATAQTRDCWADSVSSLIELRELLACVGKLLGLPPGTERGMMRCLGLDEAQRVRRLIERLGVVRDIIRALGRHVADAAPIAERIRERRGGPVLRTSVADVEREVDYPVERRGIERSGDLSRMLPSEAALLTHPTLRLLWHARRAERSLLSYHAVGVMTQRIQTEQGFRDGDDIDHERPDRGPILLVIDTSGSMVGPSETAAKAIALSVVAAATRDQRRCFLVSFSGAGDVLEHELGFDGESFARTMDFLGRSFHGGTQVDEPLGRVCERLSTREWSQSDVLLLSDGAFVLSDDAIDRIEALRSGGAVRFHAALTGPAPERFPFDHVYRVDEWSNPGQVGSEGDEPILAAER